MNSKIKLLLIPTIQEGYSHREFKGIRHVLNLASPGFCGIVEKPEDICKRNNTFYLVADYFYNPTFDPKNVPSWLHSFIQSLPSERTAIYYSDLGFGFEEPADFGNWKYFVAFNLSNYKKTDPRDYISCKIHKTVDITNKKVLRLPIPELAFWSYLRTEEAKKEAKRDVDISYIVNSRILTRKKLLRYLDGIPSQLGNFPAIDDIDINKFVNDNPGNLWETQKVFGNAYLDKQNGYFTLVVEDDNPCKAFFPMRIYEAMARGIVPIIQRGSHCEFIYDNYKYLSQCKFTDNLDLKQYISINKQPENFKKLKEDINRFMEANVYNYNLLFKKVIKELEEVLGV